MNSLLADPDIKINMSLDDIIRLTREDINSQMGSFRKRKNKKKNKISVLDHSVPLLSSTHGVGIYVSKKSPLLSAENKRRITQMVSNRVVNSQLIEKAKEIIPAEYKLIKTTHGVERVLVPATRYLLHHRKNLKPPRKLKETTLMNSSSSTSALIEDRPPPLVTAPIHREPAKAPVNDLAMEVDSPDDDIIVLETTRPVQEQKELIDVESNLPVDLLETKKLFMPGVTPITQKTLNDHFTMLTGNFSF